MRSLPSGSPYQTRGTLRPSTGEYCPNLRIACCLSAACSVSHPTLHTSLPPLVRRVLPGASGRPGGAAAAQLNARDGPYCKSVGEPADLGRCASLYVAWLVARRSAMLYCCRMELSTAAGRTTDQGRCASVRSYCWYCAPALGTRTLAARTRMRPHMHGRAGADSAQIAFGVQSKGWGGKTTVVANALCL